MTTMVINIVIARGLPSLAARLLEGERERSASENEDEDQDEDGRLREGQRLGEARRLRRGDDPAIKERGEGLEEARALEADDRDH